MGLGDRLDPLDLVEWLEEQAFEPEAQVTAPAPACHAASRARHGSQDAKSTAPSAAPPAPGVLEKHGGQSVSGTSV